MEIKCLNFAERARRGRPRKSWSQLVDEDMRLCGSARAMPWTAQCGEGPCSVQTHCSGYQMLNNKSKIYILIHQKTFDAVFATPQCPPPQTYTTLLASMSINTIQFPSTKLIKIFFTIYNLHTKIILVH